MRIENGRECLPGSAWHEWQVAGYSWRVENPAASRDALEQAASQFAHEPGWPPAGVSARFRAFVQGAKEGPYNPE